MRLIDADALKNDHHMGDECDKCETKWRECQYDYIYSKMDFCTWIDDAPTIDAVEVVRCGECIHHEEPRDTFLKAFVWCNFYNMHKLKNGYCNYGERQDGEEQNDE